MPFEFAQRGQRSHQPRYDNRYMLDIQLSSALLVLAALLLVLYFSIEIFFVYENSCTQYECGIEACALSSALIFLFATLWLLALSSPEALSYDLECIEEYAVVDSVVKSKSYGERFVWGSSLLLLMWFFVLALVPLFIIPIWAFSEGKITVIYFVLYLLILLTILLVVVFWLVAALPESMVQNNGRGSSYFYSLFLECCLGPLSGAARESDETCFGFVQRHTGSDFLVGAWIFFGLAGLSLAVVGYYVYEEYQNIVVYFILVSSLLFFLGSALLVQVSYPGEFFSRFWVCALSCSLDEGEWKRGALATPRGGEERRHLV